MQMHVLATVVSRAGSSASAIWMVVSLHLPQYCSRLLMSMTAGAA